MESIRCFTLTESELTDVRDALRNEANRAVNMMDESQYNKYMGISRKLTNQVASKRHEITSM